MKRHFILFFYCSIVVLLLMKRHCFGNSGWNFCISVKVDILMSSENGYKSDFRFRFRKMSLTVRVGLTENFCTRILSALAGTHRFRTLRSGTEERPWRDHAVSGKVITTKIWKLCMEQLEALMLSRNDLKISTTILPVKRLLKCTFQGVSRSFLSRK